MVNHFIKVSIFTLLTIFIAPACTSEKATEEDPVDVTVGCSEENKCSGENSICVSGRCEIGVCSPETAKVCSEDVTENCCKAWEFCNYDYLCKHDDNAPVGGECEKATDCKLGEFCSGGTCYESAGRQSCTKSYTCEEGERCNLSVFLCVEDVGGCSFCGDDFPELCCETGFRCDQESDRCIDTTVEAECSMTDSSKCLPSEQCDPFGQCVQCFKDEQCSGDLKCDIEVGTCYSERDNCSENGTCSGDKKCAPASDTCVIPECESDGECHADYDRRFMCNLETFKCDLPEPMCDSELDILEPNDTVGEAILIENGRIESSVLCRQENDVYQFPVTAGQRVAVRVAFPNGESRGTRLEILDDNGRQVSQTTLPDTRDIALLIFITAPELAATNYYVRVNGSGILADSWEYSVTVTTSDAPEVTTCEDELVMGIEENNTLESAYLIEAGTRQFARCNSGDIDYYKVIVPVQNGLEAMLDSIPDDGELTIEILDSEGHKLDENYDSAPSKIVSVKEKYLTYYIRVALASSNLPNIDGQQYTMTVTINPRAEVCLNDDVNEPLNDGLEMAQPIALDAAFPALLCVAEDIDFQKIVIPASTGAKVDLTFNHQDGDLVLALYNEDGSLLIESDNSKTSNGAESIDIPFLQEEKSYFLKISLASGRVVTGHAYSLNIATYDAAICFVSESVPNDDFFSGQCLGDIVSDIPCVGQSLVNPLLKPSAELCATNPETSGCASVCGLEDTDWYRVGKINKNQLLKVDIYYDASANNGQLELRLLRANSRNTGWATVQTIADRDSTGHLKLSYSAPDLAEIFVREYAIEVLPFGTTGFAALPYAIGVDIGAQCIDDAEEPNQNPSQSTFMFSMRNPGEVMAQTYSKTMCGRDIDVYELFVFPSETLTVTYAGPEGSEMYIGGRPDMIVDSATVLHTGMTLANCPLSVSNGDQDTVCTRAVMSATSTTDTFITVKQTDVMNLSGVGSYKMMVELSQ